MPGRLVAGRRELFFPRADGRETVSVRNRVSKHLGGWLRARGCGSGGSQGRAERAGRVEGIPRNGARDDRDRGLKAAGCSNGARPRDGGIGEREQPAHDPGRDDNKTGSDQQDRENERRSIRNGEGESPKAG